MYARYLHGLPSPLPPTPHTLYFWGRKSLCTTHLRKRSYAPSPWEWNISINYLEFFYLRDMSLPPPPFIHYSIHFLYQCKVINIYFILWIIVQYYFVLDCRALALGVLSIGSYAPLTFPHHCVYMCFGFCLFVFSTSLPSGTTNCSRPILYIFYSSPRISYGSEEPWFL